MKKILLLLLIQILMCSNMQKSKIFKIKDRAGEEITGATIEIVESEIVLYSNLSGKFEISEEFINKNFTVKINSISYVGIKTKLEDLNSIIILESR